MALAGTFLTWIESGSRRRSSYDLLGLVERLGFADGGLVEWALRLWPLVPVLLVSAGGAQWLTLAWRGLDGVRFGLAAIAAVHAGVVAVVIARVDESSLITVGRGPLVTIMGAVVLLAAALWELVSATDRGRSARP
jgi:hypothetical protein